jgi:hypothetical protein
MSPPYRDIIRSDGRRSRPVRPRVELGRDELREHALKLGVDGPEPGPIRVDLRDGEW